MPDTPNYKETTLSGTQYTRASQVVINNPLGSLPSLIIVEETVSNINGTEIKNQSGALNCSFDAENQLHIDIYNKLNELYVILREARDQTPTP